MPAKSGASHAFAAFLSIILGALISNFISAHTELLTDLSSAIGQVVVGITGASIPEEVSGLLLVSTFLAFLWGLAYHYARHGDNEATQPNDYVSDNHQYSSTEQMGTNASAGESSSVDDEIAGSYRTLHAAGEADETLRSKLKRDVDDLKSRIDDIHDRLYDENERERARQATEFLGAVTAFERTITRSGISLPVAPQKGRTDDVTRVDGETRQNLVDTHKTLVDTVDELVSSVETAHSAPAEVGEDSFQRWEALIADAERALSERQAIEIGETQ
jgi:hypothetical protein